MPCELVEIPGAYHGFDAIEAKAAVSKDFIRAQLSAVDKALNGG